MLKIFVGYDKKEAIAFNVLCHSIHRQSTIPVSIIPLNLSNLTSIYKRAHDDRQSNEFSFSRFLVPYLANYEGWALFMDCDMLLRSDISEILSYFDETKAVSVVKHDYKSKVSVKYLGNKQFNYPRKNWSSFILWNCSHEKNRMVTPEFVASAEAAELHRFLWLDDDDIGELNSDWNWLVGEYSNAPASVKVLHWTLGGPYFKDFADADFADEWWSEHRQAIHCEQIK